jgi:tetratricopeptide (TPR) repeat protein
MAGKASSAALRGALILHAARRHWRPALAMSAAALACQLALAQAPAARPGADKAAAPSDKARAEKAAEKAEPNSALDAPLFYQLLIGEMELRAGQAGTAYEVVLDAARRTKDESLFRRAMDIARNARAGDQALAATKAWRLAVPTSLDAVRFQAQILVALNRLPEAGEPLREWLAATPAAERPALIVALPRLLDREGDRKAAAELMERLLAPYREAKDTRANVHLALGRTWLAAGEPAKALHLARTQLAAEPSSLAGALLALELIAPATEVSAPAEQLVRDFLARPQADPGLRLAYARLLTQAQRYADAAVQVERVTREKPELAAPWLSLGALRLELRQALEAEAALTRYLELAAAEAAKPAADDDNDDDDAPKESAAERSRTQAFLLLAQAAEQRNDLPAAEAWLGKIDNPQRALEVQSRRAGLLARQGKLKEARELIRKLPERSADDARGKVLAEAQLLRDNKRWREAGEVLSSALKAQPGDVDLAYELAMVEEKLERFDTMEKLLRQVIAQKPDHAHAHNALGYSLADRNLRLPEARTLILKALELTPGDPFITDSLGWLEFRAGNRDEALRLLRQAYGKRPDAEIAAHLGEVLWASGQRDEARRVWQEARGRDAGNEVLRETLQRLKVSL